MFAFRKFKMSDEKVVGIHFQTILDSTGLTHEQFIDMCILLKCDYNRHTCLPDGTWIHTCIKGYKRGKNGDLGKKPVNLGVKSVYPMIQEYGSYEDIEPLLLDPAVVNYERCRHLFTMIPKMPFDEMFTDNLVPDLDRLEAFVKEKDAFVDVNRLRKLLQPTPIVFQNESDGGETEEDGDESVSSVEDVFADTDSDTDSVKTLTTSVAGCSLDIDNTPLEYTYYNATVCCDDTMIECGVRFLVERCPYDDIDEWINDFIEHFSSLDDFGGWMIDSEKITELPEDMYLESVSKTEAITEWCYTYSRY